MRLRPWAALMVVCVLCLASFLGAVQVSAKSAKSKKPVVKSADQRFADHEDGTILDSKTRLVWMKMDYWQTEAKWLNWFTAVEFTQKMNNKKFAGHSDWRLPAPDEAKSLYERQKVNTDKDGDRIFIDGIFPKGAGWATWTSEEKDDKAVVVSFKDEGGQSYQDKISGKDAFLRLVRGPVSK